MPFSETTILITGAASGIGLATARHLDALGARRLILVDRDEQALAAAHFTSSVARIFGDVADEALWEQVDLTGLTHAVANSGIAGAGVIRDLPFAEWRRILSVNLDGAFLTLRAALRAMSDGGSIVVTASAAGIKAESGTGAYGASKAGLIHLAKIAARESASRRIRVNAIAPGGVETVVWDQVPMFVDRAAEIGREAAFAELAALSTPLGRYASAEEIAAQIAFLLSDAAATITGTVLVSDGGYTL